MKQQFLKVALFVCISSAVFSACKKDKPEENDEEVITTMRLTFTPVGGTAVTFQYDDADGPGGGVATQDTIRYVPSKIYAVTVQLLNKTASPVEDITTEVNDEADAHRFYYIPNATSNITVSGLNNDAAGVPLGITSSWATGAAALGKLKVTLRHYPGTPPNKAMGDLVNDSKSSTDIEVEFNTKIQ